MLKLKFKEEDLLGLHFFVRPLEFPVAMAGYTQEQEDRISYLKKNFEEVQFTTEEICCWCQRHQVNYQILYPMRWQNVLKNPYRFYRYCKVKKNIVAQKDNVTGPWSWGERL